MQYGKLTEGALHELKQMITEWQPVLLLVGLPLNMDGSKSDISAQATKFSRRLAQQFSLPCQLVDERLSSREARSISYDPDHFWYKQSVDAISAALILNTWFMEQK